MFSSSSREYYVEIDLGLQMNTEALQSKSEIVSLARQVLIDTIEELDRAHAEQRAFLLAQFYQIEQALSEIRDLKE